MKKEFTNRPFAEAFGSLKAKKHQPVTESLTLQSQFPVAKSWKPLERPVGTANAMTQGNGGNDEPVSSESGS